MKMCHLTGQQIRTLLSFTSIYWNYYVTLLIFSKFKKYFLSLVGLWVRHWEVSAQWEDGKRQAEPIKAEIRPLPASYHDLIFIKTWCCFTTCCLFLIVSIFNWINVLKSLVWKMMWPGGCWIQRRAQDILLKPHRQTYIRVSEYLWC